MDMIIKKLSGKYYDTKYYETVVFDVPNREIVDKINEIIDVINKRINNTEE